MMRMKFSTCTTTAPRSKPAARAFIEAGKATIDVVGDGPERGALEALAARLGMQSGVNFRGWLPHAEVQPNWKTAA